MSADATLKVGIVRLPHAADLPLPAYQSDQAAGLDIIAAVDADTPVTLNPGARALVPTGLVLELPAGSEAQVRPRSGLAFKHGLSVLNSPGTIDADYRGEVKVLLINLGQEPFVIRRGERIAQLVVAKVTRIEFVEKTAAGATRRGAGGFGSTGTATKAASKTGTKVTGKTKKAKAPTKSATRSNRSKRKITAPTKTKTRR